MPIRLSNSERKMEWSDRIGRRIKLRDLHILLAVAECGSMAKAAEHLAISQPVLLATGRFLTIHSASYLRFSANLSIRILSVEIPHCSTPVGIVTLKNRTLNPITKLFIEHAHTVAKPLTKGHGTAA